jgi:hypothetical protein
MRAHDGKLHSANVIAVFDNQEDADEAVLQLRLSGFRDRQIGYFSQHPTRGLTDLLEHDREFAGSVIGGIAGAALGVGMAWAINRWFAIGVDAPDIFGLSITLGTFMALFVGFIGWCIGAGVERRAVDAPAVDATVGPFVVAVSAGDATDLAWHAIHHHGGHEVPPGVMMARPAMI